MTDVEVAAAAARAAAAVLTGLREEGRLSGRALGDAGDAAAQAAISGLLADHRADDVVFSEEAVDDPRRLAADRVWIVDPLDGTREYGEVPRPDWAVHVALWSAGELVAAAVALPALDEVLATDPAPAVPASGGGRPRIAVSRTRPPEVAATAAAALDAELVPMGSAGWKVTAVVRGEVDAYVHAGGMYQWDSAAPVAVARAAGLTAVRLDGSPLVYNQPDPSLPDLLVCRPELAERLLAGVRAGSQRSR
ncbi:3'(2'),5'-bisphosphate nucleotidase CysQ [Geodermatophilus sp. DF01-2]|uniref:inositol monophosphatase family protein n=1 Tax=Geodermatophilus sp. DF01-2 TaxID=2559610 RepID=UPI001073543A|nr:inositol monophosphatase family protein [Geodermatophilus sp. DF01_2]TFV60477.1 3'(2'),5'-bisphosphate nucleotidase CysQ [Geodermatophilus sp. DF01_2]